MTDFDKYWASVAAYSNFTERDRETAESAWNAARAVAAKRAADQQKRYTCKKMTGLCRAIAEAITRDEDAP